MGSIGNGARLNSLTAEGSSTTTACLAELTRSMLPIRSTQPLGPSGEAVAKHAGPPHELSGSGQKGSWGATAVRQIKSSRGSAKRPSAPSLTVLQRADAKQPPCTTCMRALSHQGWLGLKCRNGTKTGAIPPHTCASRAACRAEAERQVSLTLGPAEPRWPKFPHNFHKFEGP